MYFRQSERSWTVTSQAGYGSPYRNSTKYLHVTEAYQLTLLGRHRLICEIVQIDTHKTVTTLVPKWYCCADAQHNAGSPRSVFLWENDCELTGIIESLAKRTRIKLTPMVWHVRVLDNNNKVGLWSTVDCPSVRQWDYVITFAAEVRF